MFAKRFFYVSAGLLCLALAYHFGATSATAQAPGNPIVAAVPATGAGGVANNGVVITANGDIYTPTSGAFAGPWVFRENIFSAPTPVQQSTFGSVKVRYR